MGFKNMQFVVHSDEHFKQLQEALFALGYRWNGGDRNIISHQHYMYAIQTWEDGTITHSSEEFYENRLLDYPTKTLADIRKIEKVEEKATNPKAAIGASKLPLHLASPLAMAYMSVALANGASKYGIANYKGTEVQASIYLSALLRHFMAFLEGEEYDPVDGQPHLGGILANVAIILDARAAGTLIDDRPIAGGYLKELDKLTEIYQNIVKLHEGKNPHHYTLNNEDK